MLSTLVDTWNFSARMTEENNTSIWEDWRSVIRTWKEVMKSDDRHARLAATDLHGRRYVQLIEPIASLHEGIVAAFGEPTWSYPEPGDVVVVAYFNGGHSNCHPGTRAEEKNTNGIQIIPRLAGVRNLFPLRTIVSTDGEAGVLVARFRMSHHLL